MLTDEELQKLAAFLVQRIQSAYPGASHEECVRKAVTYITQVTSGDIVAALFDATFDRWLRDKRGAQAIFEERRDKMVQKGSHPFRSATEDSD